MYFFRPGAGMNRQNIEQLFHRNKFGQIKHYLNDVKTRGLVQDDIDCLNYIVNHPNTTPTLFAMTIHSLAKSFSNSSHTPIQNQERLISNICITLINHIPNMSAKDLTDSIWALGRLPLTWEELPENARSALLLRLTSHAQPNTMTAYETTTSLWSLAKLSLTWENLPEDTRSALLLTLTSHAQSGMMNAQDITNSLWALAMIRIKLVINDIQVISDLFNRFDSLVSEHKIEGIHQFILAFYWFQLANCFTNELHFSIAPYEAEYLLKRTPTTSRAQNAIINQLNKWLLINKDEPLISEPFVFGFELDGYLESKRIVIEIDGPHHDSREQQQTDIYQNETLAARGLTTLRLQLAGYARLNPTEKYGALSRIANAIHHQSTAKWLDLQIKYPFLTITLGVKPVITAVPSIIKQRSTNAEKISIIPIAPSPSLPTSDISSTDQPIAKFYEKKSSTFFQTAAISAKAFVPSNIPRENTSENTQPTENVHYDSIKTQVIADKARGIPTTPKVLPLVIPVASDPSVWQKDKYPIYKGEQEMVRSPLSPLNKL